MRKLLLLFALFSSSTILWAQVSNGIKLNEQRIGSAGNLLTVAQYGCNQIDVLDSTVVFIHRADPSGSHSINIGQYEFDKSYDAGVSWITNIGPFTSNPPDNDVNINGRYPQGLIYNPAGNTIPDSAWLIYSGTWHNQSPGSANGSWVGQLRGAGKLSGDTSTFTIHVDTINNGITNIASSLTQGAPGVFWNVNEDFTGTFATGSSQITQGIIVEKGVWDNITNDVDWTATEITQSFDSFLNSNVQFSVATAFNIGFDPSGQNGWIACLGDITGDSVYQPIFWKSTDGGNSWSNPIVVNLNTLPGVYNGLNAFTYGGLSVPLLPTTTFEGRLTVDYLGNPHFFTTVSNGNDAWEVYSDAGYRAYDITYNANPLPCDSNFNGWSAVFIDSIQTLQGAFTTDNPAYTEDNRPLISRSGDGKKIFFFWLDSDISYFGFQDENDGPNLFTRGFDLEHYTSTPVFNLTATDSLFGAQSTINPNGGVFPIGANFPVVSPNALQLGNSYNIPVVLTEIDYQNEGTGTRSADNPAAFWYINNITFSPENFSNGTAASVQVQGPDTVTVLIGTPYIDSGANFQYTDTTCHPVGILHLVTDTSNVNTGVVGTYYVYYAAEDSNGVVFASAVRTVVVVGPPVANFIFFATGGGKTLDFTDESTNSPTAWTWDFGDGSATSNSENPIHQYADTGTYNVCLIAANQWGNSGKLCETVPVTVISLGISPVLDNNITVYPNPTTGKVYMTLNNMSNDFTVSVCDVLGQQVMSTLEEKAGTHNMQLDLSQLSAGTYMIKVRCAAGTAVKQVVLTHNN